MPLTAPEIEERLTALVALADKLRMPGHRRTAEDCMAAQDEVRTGLRRFYRDFTGRELTRPAQSGCSAPSLRQAGLIPAALLRDRERRARA